MVRKVKGFRINYTILRRMLSVSVAMVAFGFIDNVIMVVAGDSIDNFFITKVGINNTMFAAGLGNTLSDLVGIIGGRKIESVIFRCLPKVDKEDLSQSLCLISESVGITAGCLLGLFPLLFM